MKFWMMGLGLAAAASMSSTAFAATYYLSDCQPGAQAGCVPGKATNDGLTPNTPKRLWAELPIRKGGDKILFAKGGSWVDASMGIYIATASVATPVTWDSYTPPWGGSAKPILKEGRAGRYLFNFDDGGQKKPDGGYIIRNLDLRGGGVAGASTGAYAGIFTYWEVNDLLVENVEISGFKNGVYSAQLPKAANGWMNKRITIRNSYIHDNLTGSFLGGADELVIENNILDRNGTVPILDHDIYIGTTSRSVIRNNTITRTVLDKNGKCTGSVIVVHGAVDGLTIENNKIVQPTGSIPQCFGIEISAGYDDARGSEYFHDVIIRGNSVVDVGYIGIGARGCTRCVIENNSIVWTGAGGNTGISMAVNNPSSLDERGTAMVIRNNSIYNQSPSGAGTGVVLINEGTSHTVTSNVVYFGSGATTTARCFDTKDYKSTDFKAFDYNLCYRSGGAVNYSAAFTSLNNAQLAGFDLNGKIADPLFVATPTASNSYSLAVQGGSPASMLGISAVIDRTPPAAPMGLNAR